MAKQGLVSIPEFAKEMGVSAERVRRVIKQGKINSKKVGSFFKVDLELGKKQWVENRSETAYKKNPSGKKKDPSATKVKVVYKDIEVPMFQGMTTADAERKKKVFEAKLSELKFLEQSGELIRKDEIQRAAFEAGRKVRDSVMSIPARFAHELAAETDPHKLEVHLSKILSKSLEQGMKGSYEKEKESK